jgi:oxygen-independent coproporphyrinogen-3 oxidase
MALFQRNSKKPLGIYVHIPFCRSKCAYCNFCSTPDGDEAMMDRYQKAICAHIKETGQLAPNYQVDTIYFGGGTPSFFGADRLAAILAAIRQSFAVSNQAEITFEANPDSVTMRLLRRLKSEGFNRVSMGIQSDSNQMLQLLNRPHSYEDAVEAVRMIRKAGFRNLSLDLIFGLPQQTNQQWHQTLDQVMQLNPEHMSCYMLNLEPGTPLYNRQNQLTFPSDDEQADMYLNAVEILKKNGYHQYEISNFAKRGFHSRQNTKYWTGGEYLGFGPEASSDFAGKRFSTVSDIEAYIQGIKEHRQVLVDIQEISPRERAGEYIMTRLRLTAGIPVEDFEEKFLLPFGQMDMVLDQYRATGHASFHNNRWRLTPAGLLISNTIISEVLAALDRTAAKNQHMKPMN